MNKLLIYLDNCCFNRPYDDQSQLTVHLEAQAKIFIQSKVLQNDLDLTWSYIMDYENSANPYGERKDTISKWRKIAIIDIGYDEEIDKKAQNIIASGIKKKDALHIACAIKAKCDYFITTDNKILNSYINEVIVINPLDFVRKIGG
jgi:predicted nucleic acid-binding protein